MRLLLDSNLLLRLCHPKRQTDVEAWLEGWVFYGQTHREVEVLIPAPVNYELRRGYLYALKKSPDRLDSRIALARLDAFCTSFYLVPVDDAIWHRAADLWAMARRGGFQSAPDRDIDWDVIIASQALELGAVVVTSNARHFTCYGADARDWPDIAAPSS